LFSCVPLSWAHKALTLALFYSLPTCINAQFLGSKVRGKKNYYSTTAYKKLYQELERERERERASRSSKTDMGVMSEAKSSGKKTMIRVREFGVGRDIRAVEELERRCQAGLSGGDQNPDAAAADNGGTPKKANTRSSKKAKKGMPLYVEQIGDPFSRVRHAPDYVILVI
jgi:hypothetical protein